MNREELLKILVCPKCHGDLTAQADEGFFCACCGVVYPIIDDIPVMLVEEAIPLADWQNGCRNAGKGRK